MTFLGKLRRRSSLIRSVFAVFVLAWLQTALLPCAMATAGIVQTTQVMAEHSSGETPSTADTATAAMPDMPDCVYCPPESQTGDSAAGGHDCFYPHESRMDGGRAQQLQLDQLVAHAAFIDTSMFSLLLDPAATLIPPRHLSPPVSKRSLNLTHCKQLK